VKATIIAVTDSGIINNPSAETLATWALAQHLETCGSCKHEYCPTGQRYHDAVQPDLTWIPDARTGA
jgi:hypothetical protein